MKKILLFLLIIASPISFAQNLDEDSLLLLEKGISANDKLLEFIIAHPCELGSIKNCEKPLSGKDLDTLKTLLNDLEDWRLSTFDGIAPKANYVLNGLVTVNFGDAFKVETISAWDAAERKHVTTYEMTLSDSELSHHHVKRYRHALAYNFILYDGYFRISEALAKATKLRSILEYDLPVEGKILSKTYSLASDEDLWNNTVHALNFLQTTKKSDIFKTLSKDELYFEQVIYNSFVAQRMLANDFDYRAKKALFMSRQMSQNQFYEGLNRFVRAVSKVFGNTAGMVQTRDGKLKHLAKNSAKMTEIKSKLRPMDILLEKTPMRLTDKFIPGFYGHVAIWLGSPEEISHLQVTHKGELIDLLDHPDVSPHLEKLSQGKLVVEALRKPGVTMNTLENFMDIDDFLVLATPAMSDEMLAKHLLKTFQQIGKKYDFNFDVETDKEIVCSELIYTVFTEYQWPTSISMGRYTINPDQVAWKAIDSCFEPVLLYHNGKEVSENLREELERLLTLPGGIKYQSQGECLGVEFISRPNHPPQG